MADLKPCVKCGKRKLFESNEKWRLLYGYGIGCLNPECRHELIIRFGFSVRSARDRAVRTWNRRFTND